jgi:hypothetical protein
MVLIQLDAALVRAHLLQPSPPHRATTPAISGTLSGSG